METHELDGKTVVSTGAKWESIYGYSRAVKKGNQIFINGTLGINEDGTIPDGIEAQTRRAFEIITGALKMLGGELSDVVQTRIYLTNPDDDEIVGKIHAEYFSDHRPCCTMIAVKALVVPEGLVEIEMQAVLT